MAEVETGKRLPKGMREKLIDQIASSLGGVKSYNLPAVCEGFGLATGTSGEAFSSKRNYVRNRLLELDDSTILKVAKEVEHEYPDFSLCELVRQLTECEAGPELSDLTRRAILTTLNSYDLFGDLHLVTELSKLWPVAAMPSPYGLGKTLEESIYQHCLRNEDWSTSQLLEYVGAMTCSRTLFFLLLEGVVCPNARRGDDQKNLVEELNKHLKCDGYHLVMSGTISGYPKYLVACVRGGVLGAVKNLIFAADGPKPEIVISDAINNDIKIVKNEEYCLIYDRPIGNEGLTKSQMIEWWIEREGLNDEAEARKRLSERLFKSLASDGEKNLFKVYYTAFQKFGDKLPALIPQVYLHYDPYTIKQLGGISRLPRQRMDFLILFSSTGRVVIEVDGSQHFSQDGNASLGKYAEMMHADRDLRLAGYEVYRFGSNELVGNGSSKLIADFFARLLKKYGIA